MADVTNTVATAFLPEGGMAALQGNMACWSRAWAQITQNLVSAEIAQLDLARTLYGNTEGDFARGIPQGDPRAVACQYLDLTRDRTETAILGYRRISDELMAGFFDVMKSVMRGTEWPSGKPQAAPARTTAVNISPMAAPEKPTAPRTEKMTA